MIISLSGGPPDAVSELGRSIYPLIWLGGRYGIYPEVDYGNNGSRANPDSANLHVSFASPPELMNDSRLPFLILEANGNKTLIEREKGQSRQVGKRAALLTILPTPTNALWIQGTDKEAIQKLTESLIHEQNFPAALNAGISQKLPAEVVMSIDENGLCTTHTYGPIS